jgi:2-oxo-3-(phosphooxy)propyl 3-oxoalkanoate synthase
LVNAILAREEKMTIAEQTRPVQADITPWEFVSRVAHQHTISRELTHKRRLENVYVTSLSPMGAQSPSVTPSEFLFGAFVPQSNVYINDMRSHANDVVLSVVEIGRQIGIALSHEYLGVRPKQAFVLDRMVFEALPALHKQDWHASETLWGQVRISQQVHNAEGELSSTLADGAFYAQDRCVCTQSSQWSILPRERYQRLREIARNRNARRPGQMGEPVPLGPGFTVSLDSTARQPVLAPTLWVSSSGNRFVATLLVDRRNLFFFDHDNDHVPGMLVLEGMRSMALDIVGKFTPTERGPASLARIEVSFKTFAELDAPVQLVATVRTPPSEGQPMALHVEARQLDRVFASGDFVAA